jgi:PIN domain nuclease of toxin-antitoxin system
VKVLLDTHILLWWLADDGSLPREARRMIRDGATQAFVSAASAWR